MLKIRPAVLSDASTILKFIRELAEFEKLLHEVKADEKSLIKTLFTENNGVETVIAEVNGTAAGFALYFKSYSTFLAKPGIYLEDLYVSPAFRSQGIGEALLKHLAKICLDRDYGRLEWSVLDWNKRAIQFYRRVGAVGLNDWTVQRLDEAALKNFVHGEKTSN
jgi:GNAT superfamily N-acetyltransferase